MILSSITEMATGVFWRLVSRLVAVTTISSRREPWAASGAASEAASAAAAGAASAAIAMPAWNSATAGSGMARMALLNVTS
jgi:hypothetical protein